MGGTAKSVSTWSERGNAYLASAPSQRQDLDRQIAADGGGRSRQLGAFDMPPRETSLQPPFDVMQRAAQAALSSGGAAVRRGGKRKREMKCVSLL